MRVQILASLALLQLHSFAAAAAGKGSNTMLDTNGPQGIASSPISHSKNGGAHQQGNGAKMGSSKGDASLDQGATKNSKGLPRMEAFPGIHISPVSGGVVNHLGSATTEARRALPSRIAALCPVVARRGDFLVRKCPSGETIEGPIRSPGELMERNPSTVATKPSPFAGEVWTRADACNTMDRRGEFVAKRCSDQPPDLDPTMRSSDANNWKPTTSSTKASPSGTTEGIFFPTALSPVATDQCGVARRGNLLARIACCDSNCDGPIFDRLKNKRSW